MNTENLTTTPLNLTVEVVERRPSMGSGFLEDSAEAVDGSCCCCCCSCGIGENEQTEPAE